MALYRSAASILYIEYYIEHYIYIHIYTWLPQWLSGKNSAFDAGDAGDTGDVNLVSGLGRVLGEEHGNPFQYSCPEIPWTEEPGGLQSIGLQRVRHN